MNGDILLLLCEQVLGDSEEDLHFVVSLGWISAEIRALTRQGDPCLIWRTWKRLCAQHAVTSRSLCSQSVHRQDLSLTARSRCYTADANGFFRPHGGNGSDRCENLQHYYRNTLTPKWPTAALGETVSRQNYIKWTLQKLASRDVARTRRHLKLAAEWLQHRDACARLAERPWLLDEVEALLDEERRPLSAKRLEKKRKFADLR